MGPYTVSLRMSIDDIYHYVVAGFSRISLSEHQVANRAWDCELQGCQQQYNDLKIMLFHFIADHGFHGDIVMYSSGEGAVGLVMDERFSKHFLRISEKSILRNQDWVALAATKQFSEDKTYITSLVSRYPHLQTQNNVQAQLCNEAPDMAPPTPAQSAALESTKAKASSNTTVPTTTPTSTSTAYDPPINPSGPSFAQVKTAYLPQYVNLFTHDQKVAVRDATNAAWAIKKPNDPPNHFSNLLGEKGTAFGSHKDRCQVVKDGVLTYNRHPDYTWLCWKDGCEWKRNCKFSAYNVLLKLLIQVCRPW